VRTRKFARGEPSPRFCVSMITTPFEARDP
jgi:hypothetical protein